MTRVHRFSFKWQSPIPDRSWTQIFSTPNGLLIVMLSLLDAQQQTRKSSSAIRPPLASLDCSSINVCLLPVLVLRDALHSDDDSA